MEPVCRMLIHKPIIGLNGRTYICIFKYHFYFENDSVLNRVTSKSLYDDSLWSIDREKNLLVSPTFYGSNLYDISIEVNSQKRQMFIFRPGNALINVGNFWLGSCCSECGKEVDYNQRKYCESCGNESLFFSGELDYPKDFLFPPENELHEALEKYEWIDSHYMKLIINSFPISINSKRETINRVILELAKLDRRNFEALHSQTTTPFTKMFTRINKKLISFSIGSIENSNIDVYLDKVDGTTLFATDVTGTFKVESYIFNKGDKLYLRGKAKHKTISDLVEIDLSKIQF